MKETNFENNLRQILDKDELYNIIPNESMNVKEKKIVIIRLILYISIVLSLVTANMVYISFFILLYITFKIYDVESFQSSTSSAANVTTGSAANVTTGSVANVTTTKVPSNFNILDLDRFTGNNFVGIKESSNIINSNYKDELIDGCIKPTKNNPFSNTLIFNEYSKNKACIVTDDIKKETLKHLNKYPSLNDLYNPDNSLLPFSYYPEPIDTYNDLHDWLYKVPFSCKNKPLGKTGSYSHGSCSIFE